MTGSLVTRVEKQKWSASSTPSQFEDGLPQPAVLRFENRKEPYRPTLWFSAVLFMQFPIRCF
jgi:hypothetical protein